MKRAAGIDSIVEILRCPATGDRLVRVGEHAMHTGDGSRSYPVIDGVPVLIARERSLFDPEAIARVQAQPSATPTIKARLKQSARWLLHLPPTPSRNIGSGENYRELRRLLHRGPAASGPVRLLVIGGATVGVGAVELLSDPAFELVETDVYIAPRTRIVCDGHDLPFADASFDAVICQAVLEHVIDPVRVAEEVWRVLKPGGLVYSEVPFMQQVHLGAFDFTRFTQLGHRRLWRHFDELRAGAQGGPGMALIWSIAYFMRAPLPPKLWPLADRLASLGFFWLKYLDGYLVRLPGGIDGASGTFFLGSRRPTPVEDRVIVSGYRGGGPRLHS